MTEWFARPVLHVADVKASLRFYARLGFTSSWRYEEDGRARVAQVDRQGCALILADNLSDQKIGKAVIFISLNVEPATPENEVAALDTLRVEFQGTGISVTESFWGYRLLVVDDIDGNQLLFNYPAETASPDSATVAAARVTETSPSEHSTD